MKNIKVIIFSTLFIYSSIAMQPPRTAQQSRPLEYFLQNTKFKTFNDWYEACQANLTLPREAQGNERNQTVLDLEEFGLLLDTYFKIILEKFLQRKKLWTNKAIPQDLIDLLSPANPGSDDTLIDPYIEQLTLKKGDKVFIHGDWHGEAPSGNDYLINLRKQGYLDEDAFFSKDPNVYYLNLGDYTDRGRYNSEMLYILIRFWISNPDNVILMRGNHEDVHINEDFLRQLLLLYPPRKQTIDFYNEKILKFYECLPIALYVRFKEAGSNQDNALVAFHAGADPGVSPEELLQWQAPGNISFAKLGIIDRIGNLEKLKNVENQYLLDEFNATRKVRAENPDDIFQQLQEYIQKKVKNIQLKPFNPKIDHDAPELFNLWADYIPTPKKIIAFNHERGGGTMIGRLFHKMILAVQSTPQVKIRTALRAHQHTGNVNDPTMIRILNLDKQDVPENKGVGRFWLEFVPKDANPQALIDEGMYTFLIAPLAGYTNTFIKKYGPEAFNFDAWGLLTIGATFDTSTLAVQKNYIDIVPKQPIPQPATQPIEKPTIIQQQPIETEVVQLISPPETPPQPSQPEQEAPIKKPRRLPQPVKIIEQKKEKEEAPTYRGGMWQKRQEETQRGFVRKYPIIKGLRHGFPIEEPESVVESLREGERANPLLRSKQSRPQELPPIVPEEEKVDKRESERLNNLRHNRLEKRISESEIKLNPQHQIKRTSKEPSILELLGKSKSKPRRRPTREEAKRLLQIVDIRTTEEPEKEQGDGKN